jgi:hypothetical protein
MHHNGTQILLVAAAIYEKAQQLVEVQKSRPHHSDNKYLEDDIRALAAQLVNDKGWNENIITK